MASFSPSAPKNYQQLDAHKMHKIDCLTITAAELQDLLTAGKITSVKLVESYITQISNHDDYLRAVLSICPTALRQAKRLDAERRDGRVRGPLHGIPVLIKDNIATCADLGMDTTVGSFALVGSRPKKNAEVVDRMISAGMIILGKTQMSEFGGYKGLNISAGWSAVGGQTQSAYTTGDMDPSDGLLGHSSPSGSSTGSAVSVSAGFAPVALGSETVGSIITPATRAALYALRPTINLVPQSGVFPLSHHCDTVGPMAKTVVDLANLMDVLVHPPPIQRRGSYVDALPGDFSQLRIGALRPEDWYFDTEWQKPVPSATAQIIQDTYAAYKKLQKLAKSFQFVTLVSPDKLFVDGSHSLYKLFDAQFEKELNRYLQQLMISRVRTLEDVIEYNQKYPDLELPPGCSNQDQLIIAANIDVSKEECDKLLAHARHVSRVQGIDKTLKDYDLDIIICPADSEFNVIVSAAGYPSATMPLSYLDYNGRPIGLAAFTTANQEKTLLKFLSAWEANFPKRKPPPSLTF